MSVGCVEAAAPSCSADIPSRPQSKYKRNEPHTTPKELTQEELHVIMESLQVDKLAELLEGADLDGLEELQLSYGADALLNLKRDLDRADEAHRGVRCNLSARL